MFASLLYERASAAYEKHILLLEEDALEEKTGYCAYFRDKGFAVLHYNNDLEYRVDYEERVKQGEEKILLLAKPGAYIPYDVIKSFRVTRVSLAELFPKLNAVALREEKSLNYELLCMAVKKNFETLTDY